MKRGRPWRLLFRIGGGAIDFIFQENQAMHIPGKSLLGNPGGIEQIIFKKKKKSNSFIIAKTQSFLEKPIGLLSLNYLKH